VASERNPPRLPIAFGMKGTTVKKVRFGARVLLALALGVAATMSLGVSPSTAGSSHVTRAKPTVVLVHGGYADASGWDGVIDILQRDGYPVVAVANPLRGLKSDAAYLRSVIKSIPGPLVLVGHSYGGAVITNAATGAKNVKALVYLAAFALDKGESVSKFADPVKFPGSELTPAALSVHPFPGGTEGTIKPELFHEIFAADLPRSETSKMAVRQRPVSLSVFDEVSGVPAWRSIPSWYQVSAQDKAISPAAERFFAKRMQARTTEIKASHVGFMSQPKTTARLIEKAAGHSGH
jgi:pimeloyl-ACP methyl ester carboxylesterase